MFSPLLKKKAFLCSYHRFSSIFSADLYRVVFTTVLKKKTNKKRTIFWNSTGPAIPFQFIWAGYLMFSPLLNKKKKNIYL
jgi:hypothetical protein